MSSPSSSAQQGDIRQVQLKGHSSSVTCLALNNHHNTNHNNTAANTSVLLSGSEDGTARLWDLRQQRASLCIILMKTSSSDEITSVSFDPPPPSATPSKSKSKNKSKHKHTTTTTTDVTRLPFAQDYTVWLSSGTSICGYDLRNATSPIVRDCSEDYTDILQCEDEVNQISFARSGRRSVFLAAAEDGGVIRVLDTTQQQQQQSTPNHNHNNNESNRQPYRTLYHGDASVMVTSAVFRPPLRRGGNAIHTDLISGGTDCTIHLWDVTRPRKPLSTVQITQEATGANQVCNPPMVHSLAWSPSGRLVAAGLGDGTCSVLRVTDRRTLVPLGRLSGGHDASVACVSFGKLFHNSSSSCHVAAHDRLLVSAGSDGAILLWDLGAEMGGTGAVDPTLLFHPSLLTENNNNNNHSPYTLIEDGMKDMSLSSQQSTDPHILFGIPHTHKPNWLVTSSGSDSVFPSSLFVADTSSDITIYTLPQQQ